MIAYMFYAMARKGEEMGACWEDALTGAVYDGGD